MHADGPMQRCQCQGARCQSCGRQASGWLVGCRNPNGWALFSYSWMICDQAQRPGRATVTFSGEQHNVQSGTSCPPVSHERRYGCERVEAKHALDRGIEGAGKRELHEPDQHIDHDRDDHGVNRRIR
jgi:hypothetical protein